MNEDLDNLYNPNLYQRPGCILQACGTNFEPELFLMKTTFGSELILFKGKLGLPVNLKDKMLEANPELEIFETPFLLLEVSKAKVTEIQLNEAMSFLRQYQDEIQRLQSFPQVEFVSMEFLATQGEPLFNSRNMPYEFSELVFKSGIANISCGTAASVK